MSPIINYFICYDISNHRLRHQIAQLLTRLGCVRCQKSVFMAQHFEKKEIEHLQKKLDRLLQRQSLSDTDSVLCVPSRQPSDGNAAYLWHGTAQGSWHDDDETVMV